MNLVTASKLAAAIGICLLVGMAGSLFNTPQATEWYQGLRKPWFTPADWVFAPVWTILYILMGISLFLVWQKGLHIKEVRMAIVWFGIQLALNFIWTSLFFGLKSPLAAFIELLMLLTAIIVTFFYMSRASMRAAVLLTPYIIWTIFAGLLNGSIWYLNR